MLQVRVYRYEYLDVWENIITWNKIGFYSSLNMKYITAKNYEHARRVWKNIGIKNLAEHNNLYVQSDTLLLGKIFENFWSSCIKIYMLLILFAPGLLWQAA